MGIEAISGSFSHLHESFNHLDNVTQDGMLDQNELVNGGWDSVIAQQRVSEADTNRDGKLSGAEISNILANWNAPKSEQSLEPIPTNTEPMLDRSAIQASEPAAASPITTNPSNYGAPPPADSTGLRAALSQSGHEIGTYQVTGLSAEKEKLINTATAQGATREETAWLLAHAMIEDQSMKGSKNGDGKQSLAYNVGIFNMNAGMVMSLSGYSEHQARDIGYEQSVGLMLDALHTYGFAETEALIRGGGTGRDELRAGFPSDTYGVREWTQGVGLRTNAVLNNPDLFSGDARFTGGIRRV